MMLKKIFKFIVFILFLILLCPIITFYFVLKLVRIETFTGFSQVFALFPGLLGIYLRRAWYRFTLAKCGKNLTVDFLGAVRTPKTKIGNNCYVGVGSWIGWSEIGDDVMISGHVTVLSGGHQHATQLSQKMRHQKVTLQKIKIADDVWIGDGAIVMADIAEGSIVGAGSVLTKSFPANTVLAGVPAKALKTRS